jgi:hypothetical protein
LQIWSIIIATPPSSFFLLVSTASALIAGTHQLNSSIVLLLQGVIFKAAAESWCMLVGFNCVFLHCLCTRHTSTFFFIFFYTSLKLMVRNY